MRHLKLFENFGEELYSRTTQEEFDRVGFDSEYKGVKFKSSLKRQILDRLNPGWSTKERITNDCDLRLKKDNGSQLFIYYSEDEWYYCEYYNVDEFTIQDRYKNWRCDQFEGLIQLLKDLDIISDNISESLADDQIEDLADIFVEVADKYNLIEWEPGKDQEGSKPSDSGTWRLSRLGGVHSELFVQVNVQMVDIDKLEEDLYKFLEKAQKLNIRWGKIWWRDIYQYPFYKASRYMIKLS